MLKGTLNEVRLIAQLAKSPILRKAKNGTCYCIMDVATFKPYVNDNGELKERTEWIPLKFWGDLAENAAKMLNRGSIISVLGRIDSYSFEKNGNRVYKTEVVAEQLKVLNKEELEKEIINN